MQLAVRTSRVKCWLEAGLSFFYPEVCQHCGDERATADEGFVGSRCRELVNYIEPPFCERCGLPYEGAITGSFECGNCREMDLRFKQARSVVAARGMVLAIIHRYKYQRALWFEPFLAGLLLERAGPVLREEPWDLIVPVPLHPSKQAEREFNQAERLARRLGAALRFPVSSRILQRVEPTRTQTQLSRAQRAANVQNAFAVRQGASPAGKRIVLIDDVLTTGATTSACAKTLIEAKAAEVCVWTVARAVSPVAPQVI